MGSFIRRPPEHSFYTFCPHLLESLNLNTPFTMTITIFRRYEMKLLRIRKSLSLCKWKWSMPKSWRTMRALLLTSLPLLLFLRYVLIRFRLDVILYVDRCFLGQESDVPRDSQSVSWIRQLLWEVGSCVSRISVARDCSRDHYSCWTSSRWRRGCPTGYDRGTCEYRRSSCWICEWQCI